MEQNAVATALVWLTEAPGARLRCLAPELHSPAERNALAALRLIAVLHDVYLVEDDLRVAQRLAELDAQELAELDAALQALELHDERRRLLTAWHALTRGMDALPADLHVLHIAERYEQHIGAIWRLLFIRNNVAERIEQRLVEYLDRHPNTVPDWQPRSGPDRQRAAEIAPAATRVFTREGQGDKHLFILRQHEADALLDQWIRENPHSTYHRGATQQRIARIDEARSDSRRWFHGMPKGSAMGKLRHGRTARLPLHAQLCGVELDAALTALAEDFEWVIFPWPNTMQESPLAWLSSDPRLADAWDSLLRRFRSSLLLISRYYRFSSLPAHAGGIQFGENSGYGDAALVAAQDEPWLPWLVAEIDVHSRHSWRRWTQRLRVGAIAQTFDQRSIWAIYRASEVQAYSMLWRGLDRGDGIVRATVCGRDEPARVLQSFQAARHSSDFHMCNALSERHGWIYRHVYGGGADEHHAMFHAQDPAITQRVAALAMRKPDWYLSGWW